MIKDKEIDMKVITGLTRVRWSSAMGVLEGTVKRVDTAKNAPSRSRGNPHPNLTEGRFGMDLDVTIFIQFYGF